MKTIHVKPYNPVLPEEATTEGDLIEYTTTLEPDEETTDGPKVC